MNMVRSSSGRNKSVSKLGFIRHFKFKRLTTSRSRCQLSSTLNNQTDTYPFTLILLGSIRLFFLFFFTKIGRLF